MKAFTLSFMCVFVLVLLAVLRTVDAEVTQTCDMDSDDESYQQKPCAYQDQTIDTPEPSVTNSKLGSLPPPPMNLRTPPPLNSLKCGAEPGDK